MDQPPNGDEQPQATPPEPERKKQDRSERPWLRPVLLLNGLLALLLAVLLAVWFAPSSGPPEPPPPQNEVLSSVNATGFVYEEYMGQGLEEQVKRIDYALLDAMRDQEVDLGDLRLDEVQIMDHQGEYFHYQVLRVPLIHGAKAFLERLNADLAQRAPEAGLTKVGDNEYLVSVDGAPTHRIFLLAPSTPKPAPLPGKGSLVIVIDDLGENLSLAKGLANLPVPVTFAIWPRASQTEAVARLAKQRGLEILVHMPMEPKGYPKDNPGQGALFASMDAEQITELVLDNLARVPGAVGMNNHMGSAFTESYPGMLAALTPLAQRGLFFLDSRTTGKSAASRAAAQAGLPCYARDVFLDNVADVDAVLLQLRKAERLALSRGQAIAIGHPHQATLRALQIWAASKPANLSVVTLSRLTPR